MSKQKCFIANTLALCDFKFGHHVVPEYYVGQTFFGINPKQGKSTALF